MAAPLNEDINDLVRNAEIFVPMLFKMAIAGTRSGQIAYTIGKDEVLEAKHQPAASGETLYKLRLLHAGKGAPSDEDPTQPAEDGSEFIPEQRILGSKVLLTPGRQVQDAGWYQLKQRADSTLATYAFNFDRRESELRYRSDEELETQLRSNLHLLSEREETNFAQIVDEQNQGVTLWRWCIVFALLFLALEVLFLRLWKV
jgi:hypothetical protein